VPGAPAVCAPEIGSFLDLMATQLEGSLRESEAPLGAIAAAIGALASEAQALERALPGVGPRLREAVVALQFYDRLSQRLTHVRDGLMLLAGALQNPAAGQAPWADLHERVRRQYSMEQERRIFELAAAGAPPEEFSKALATHSTDIAEDRVELF
jgi:hypothetical protein